MMNRIGTGPLLLLALSTLLASTLLLATSASALTQYAYPPPGSPSFAGAGASPGDAGGLTWSFSAWNTAEYLELHVGAGFHAAGLDGTAHDLTFAGISGQEVTYTGSSAWTSPGGTVPAGAYVVPITMTVTLTGYGATPWSPAGSVDNVATLDPTIGAVADVTAGLDFSLNFLIEATVPVLGTVPINQVPQPPPPPYDLTQSSIGTTWFATVPEPGTALLLGLGLAGLAGVRDKR